MRSSECVFQRFSIRMTASSRQRAQPVPVQQDLLVEGDHQLTRVAPVGHRSRADADPVAAPSRGTARRRLDLGRDDLHRPGSVPHLRRDRAEDLPALLGTFAGVRDDLDRVLACVDERPVPDRWGYCLG
jgi:hypothetical protein